MIVSRPNPLSRLSSRVPSQAFIRIFSTTKSPSFASRPSAGAAPHEPRTSAPVSFTPANSGALTFKPGAPVLDDVPDVDHGDALAPARLRERLHVLDDVLLLRVLRSAGLRERAAVDHHVVLQVLDDQHAARRVQAQPFVVHAVPPMYGSLRGPTIVSMA